MSVGEELVLSFTFAHLEEAFDCLQSFDDIDPAIQMEVVWSALIDPLEHVRAVLSVIFVEDHMCEHVHHKRHDTSEVFKAHVLVVTAIVYETKDHRIERIQANRRHLIEKFLISLFAE